MAELFGRTRSVRVPDDWADGWRRFHRPVEIGRLWVGPPWEQAPASAVSVTIDPGLAFGTGAHPTTRLCLEALQALLPGSLLDVGCGSGILAVAAARLGFRPVFALDVDPAAVAAAAENAAGNGVEVEVRQADALAAALPTTDVAVANLELKGVERVAARLRAGRLVASGYLAADVPTLPDYRLVERRTADGWAADLYARR
jgi:ribosomal protein L11 methyltransferase